MGQVVSYLFRCCEAEKEQSSYDDPNLLTGPLVAPPSLVSCIGSSADGAVHQFMVHDSGIQDVEDRRKVYPPRWKNSCSDSSTNEGLQQDKLNCPPNEISSIGSRTVEALLQDLVIAPPTVVASISPSSNEALQQHQIIAPPTIVMSIESKTNEELQQDVLNFPPTVVPSIDSSTNEELKQERGIDSSTNDGLQQDPVIAASTVARSIDTSTNNSLQHDLVIASSAVVQSISSIIDNTFHQFNETDSVIEVLENKRTVYQLIEELEEKEPRELGEKHEDKQCIEGVQIERKINHYSSSQKILLVGEGDFSFSACLAIVFGSASNMVATSLDSEEFLHTNYKKAESNICELRRRGCKVMHSMDATEMANNSSLNALKFDRIIYNFPLAGFFPDESRKFALKRNTNLILKFLDNAKKLISENGEIHITHKSCGFFLEWDLEFLASNVGLWLIDEVPFNFLDYEGYNTKYGFGGDKNFNCKPSKTYKFGLNFQISREIFKSIFDMKMEQNQ